MLITKNMEMLIDLTINEMYSMDINKTILKKLNDILKNKCKNSILILEVLNIIKRSEILLCNDRFDGKSSVNVYFTVRGIILSKGEILNGSKIIEIHTNAITAEHKYASIILKKNDNGKLLSIISPNDIIPIIIEEAVYNPYQSTISVIGKPFMPDMDLDLIYYKINNKLSNIEKEKLKLQYKIIDEEEKKHLKIKKEKNYKFFQELLYPFQTEKKINLDKNSKKINLDFKSIENINNGYIIYPKEDSRINKRFYLLNKYNNKNATIINSSAFSILAGINNEYLSYIRALRGFVETYNTIEKMKDMINYWKLCKKMKK